MNARAWSVTAVALLVAVAGACGAPPGASPGAPALPPRYSGPPTVGPENITFLYHTIADASAAGQLGNIGHPRDLVYGSKNDAAVPGTADEPVYAHGLGARAFKYMQVTWFPALSNSWLGTTGAQRSSWALCKSGNIPLTDAGDGDGASHAPIAWHYADANERGYVNAVLAWTGQLKALGYDGVFIDTAGRALRGPYWKTASTCTEDPMKPGAKSSDAWFDLLMRIKGQGLLVSAMNVGAPTAADPISRQDPNRPTAVKTDVRALTWVLHENAGRPLENYPAAVPASTTYGTPFDTLALRVKKDAQLGRGMVVEMAKARLALDDPNRFKQEEYVWALAKLSGGPVVLNAGYDFCNAPPGTTDCNRTGLNPKLTDIRLGTPIDSAPYAAACNGASCTWVRRFQNGMVVVAAYGTPRRAATVPLGVVGCRRITAFQGGAQAKGGCVTSLVVGTGPPRWSRVYLYTSS